LKIFNSENKKIFTATNSLFKKKGRISRENNTKKNLPHFATIFSCGAVFHQFSPVLTVFETLDAI
jgi:hypothetical protein